MGGDAVPQDAKDFKDELGRITKYVEDLQKKVAIECDKYSEDVKFWAEYKTGIKEFTPWLASPREPLVKVFPNPLTWMKPRPFTIRSTHSTNPALTISSFWRLPMLLLRRCPPTNLPTPRWLLSARDTPR